MHYLIGGSVIVIMMLSGVIYFLKKDNDTLRSNNAKLEVAFVMQKAATEALKESIGQFEKALILQAEATEALTEFTETATKQLRKMNDVFAKHDFQKLLDRKPGLIINRVNDGIADINRMFECATARGGCSPVSNPGAETPAVIPTTEN